MALDRKKEFMTVSGSTGVRFQQGNKLFLATGLECNVNGELIEEDEEALKLVEEEKKAKDEEALATAKLKEKQEKARQVELEKERKKTTVGKKAPDAGPKEKAPVDFK